jgi:6-phosphogluconolactonase
MADASPFKTEHGTVNVLFDSAALAAALADTFVELAGEAIAARGRFAVALAGGSTPRAAYALLVMEPRRKAVEWKAIEVFFGDERCVSTTSSESNFRMANETLLSRVALTPERIHRMRGEAEPAEAARAYADEIRNTLGEEPVFDLILLGLGADAHTASWFPGVAIPHNLLVDAPYIPKFSTHRITLTPPVVNAARHLVVTAGGSEKAKAISEVFSAERNEALYPAQRLAPTNGTLTWLIDRATAEGLPVK